MLPPEGQSDRFLATKVLKLLGCRREKYVICYVWDSQVVGPVKDLTFHGCSMA